MTTGTALLAVLVLGLTGCRTAPDRPETERTGPTSPAALQEQAPAEQPASSTRASFHPATYDGWLRHVPEGLPLAVGMTRPDGDVSRSHAPVRLETCGQDALRRSGALDSRAVTTTGPELGDQHEVRVFVDDRAAAAFLHRVLTRVRSCPTEDHTTTRWTLRARPTRTGFVAVRTYADSGHVVPGADWWEASRTGNGVLLTSIHGRNDARSYAKTITAWRCDVQLSPEEEQALGQLRGK